MTLSDLWPQFQGHDIFRHWISQKKRAIVIDLDWPLNASSPLSASAELLVIVRVAFSLFAIQSVLAWALLMMGSSLAGPNPTSPSSESSDSWCPSWSFASSSPGSSARSHSLYHLLHHHPRPQDTAHHQRVKPQSVRVYVTLQLMPRNAHSSCRRASRRQTPICRHSYYNQ